MPNRITPFVTVYSISVLINAISTYYIYQQRIQSGQDTTDSLALNLYLPAGTTVGLGFQYFVEGSIGDTPNIGITWGMNLFAPYTP